MIHIPAIALQTPDKIKDFQFQKLKEVLYYLEQRSPFYKNLFAANKISASGIRAWSDFELLPVTTKDDIQNYNWNFLCVERGDVAEYTSTSGTLGKPVTIALTKKDIERLAYNEAISFACADGDNSDLYQLMLTLDRQFMAGIAYYEGIRKLGAGLIRVGPGLPVMQWETIERLKPSVIVGVPSFIYKLVDFAGQQGIDLNKSSVKKAICIGESLRGADLRLNMLGKKIQDSWNIHLYSTYASTEMQTAFTECSEGQGGHHHPELIIVELLDEIGNAVKPGVAGEITITTLGVEGMPLLRYRTGDIAHMHEGLCKCGRSTVRLGPVIGRKQQMIKLKGTTLYPPSIFEILHQNEIINDYVVETFTGALGTDELKLYIHVKDGPSKLMETKLHASFQSRLRVVPEITFVSLQEMEALQHTGNSRKLKKFIDSRS